MIILEVLSVTLAVAGATMLTALIPGLPGYSVRGPSQSFVLVLLEMLLLLLLVGSFRWWSLAGFTPPVRWHRLRLYWLPVALLAVPFAGGVKMPPLSAIAILLVGYLATAVYEEGLWRGVMVGLLRPSGVWKSVLITSLLFGLAHLGNSALRGLSPLIAAQAFGAAVQGIGLAALRLRTNTIWPLIVIHFLHDLFLQMSALPIPLVEVPIDTIMAIYGIILLRHHRRHLAEDPDSPHRRGLAQGSRAAADPSP
ncbi:membrane protease YdiL (CAAX protease family) [Microlunatus panaciterrae]|uniref:Membrane protease YdiL (CAAX protease family) n=1 Tax=Microlunatus panaciterrae TaxID=400768 RepID=A0ABS2REG2_9ACTN|nr:membrane protease YdiL (CAAX protease family) [Microlunatus panaciterrae]